VIDQELYSAGFNIASVVAVFRLKFTEENIFLSHLRSLYVCLGVVSKEQVVISSVLFHPLSELRISYKSEITIGLVMTRFVTEEEFLEICVVENVGVSSPSVVGSLLVFSNEANSVEAHKSDEFFRL